MTITESTSLNEILSKYMYCMYFVTSVTSLPDYSIGTEPTAKVPKTNAFISNS